MKKLTLALTIVACTLAPTTTHAWTEENTLASAKIGGGLLVCAASAYATWYSYQQYKKYDQAYKESNPKNIVEKDSLEQLRKHWNLGTLVAELCFITSGAFCARMAWLMTKDLLDQKNNLLEQKNNLLEQENNLLEQENKLRERERERELNANRRRQYAQRLVADLRQLVREELRPSITTENVGDFLPMDCIIDNDVLQEIANMINGR